VRRLIIELTIKNQYSRLAFILSGHQRKVWRRI